MAATPAPVAIRASPFGRRLSDFEPLNLAEIKLRAACRKGNVAVIGDTCPESATDDNIIRAEVLRFFLLGGDDQNPVHEIGVRVKGAFIAGQLNVIGCALPHSVALNFSRFEKESFWQYAEVNGALSFNGSASVGINADGLTTKGDLFLKNGFSTTGTVRLLGAQIGGDLTFNGANFEVAEGYALSADGMNVKGSVFLKNGFSTTGAVRLLGAQIGGGLDCGGAWGDDLVLDGFRYGALAGGAPTDAQTRLAWLSKQEPDDLQENFRPQPWQHLQTVLREMGHWNEARSIGFAFEEKLYQTQRIKGWVPRRMHQAFGGLAGYGYRPMRLIGWMMGVWFLAAVFYWYAALQGVFAPSNPLVFQNSDYAACKPDMTDEKLRVINPKDKDLKEIPGAKNWYLCERLAAEYAGFSPLAYSLDLILPLVDLQQDKDWGPLIETPKSNPAHELVAWTLNHLVRFVIWFEILFGWLASLLMVAIVSGLAKRRDE